VYRGSKLADLAAPGVTERAARRMADRGGARLTERLRELTPEDSGATRAAWRQTPVEREARGGRPAYRTSAVNDRREAAWLEWGVAPHTIKPKREPAGADALPTGKGPRAEVHHPGIRARHLVSRATAEVETALPELLRPDAEAWADEQEAAAKRHPGIT
jgi:hypothetical protein